MPAQQSLAQLIAGPNLDEVDWDDEEDLQLLAQEQAARTESFRQWNQYERLSEPWAPGDPAIWGMIAGPLCWAGAVISLAFTFGPVLWVFVAGMILCALPWVLVEWPKRLAWKKRLNRWEMVPAAIVRYGEDGTQYSVVNAKELSTPEDLHDLVTVAETVEQLIANPGERQVSPEVATFLDRVVASVTGEPGEEGVLDPGSSLPVPRELGRDLEWRHRFWAPDGDYSSRLMFLFRDTDTSAWPNSGPANRHYWCRDPYDLVHAFPWEDAR